LASCGSRRYESKVYKRRKYKTDNVYERADLWQRAYHIVGYVVLLNVGCGSERKTIPLKISRLSPQTVYPLALNSIKPLQN